MGRGLVGVLPNGNVALNDPLAPKVNLLIWQR